MPYSFFNNTFIASEEFKIDSSNRSFRYGDGLFETIFVSNQIPVFIHLHIERLHKGMQFMQLHIPAEWTADYFAGFISELAKKNNYQNSRCRISVWRAGAGYYLPDSNQAEVLIELQALENENYILNTAGLKLGVYRDLPKMIHPFSAIKSAQSVPYILASLFAREQKLDDAVLVNTAGRVVDATSSNIFIYKERKLFTPANDEGGVEGIMRKVIIALCRMEGIEVIEKGIEVNELLYAEEIFLTNSISGIKWVESFQYKKYTNQFAKDLIFVLNEQKNNNSLVSP